MSKPNAKTVVQQTKKSGPPGPSSLQVAKKNTGTRESFYDTWDRLVQKRNDACSTLFIYMSRVKKRIAPIGLSLAQNIQFNNFNEQDWFNEGAAYLACNTMTKDEKDLILKRILVAQIYENPNYVLRQARVLIAAFDMDYSFFDCCYWPGPMFDSLVTYNIYKQTELFRGFETEKLLKQKGDEILTWMMLKFVEVTSKPCLTSTVEIALNNVLKYLQLVKSKDQFFTEKMKFIRVAKPELFPKDKPKSACFLELVFIVNGMIQGHDQFNDIQPLQLTGEVNASMHSLTKVIHGLEELAKPKQIKRK